MTTTAAQTKANQYGSTLVRRETRINAHGFRHIYTICSCGTETRQGVADGTANLCGRCGYLTDYSYKAV